MSSIPMEEEVCILFLVCAGILFAGKVLFGIFSCSGRMRSLFFGHLACELLSLFFLSTVLFRGRVPWAAASGLVSIDNSVGIGLFGVFWAFSTLLLLQVIGRLGRRPQDAAEQSDS